MKWLTLDYIKKHSRLDYNIEDDLLTIYAESAEDQVLNDIGRSYAELIQWQGEVPKAILHASLMLVDFAYEQRSPVDKLNWSVVPYTYERLIKPYIRLASLEYDNVADGAVCLGSQIKVEFTATLADDLHLEDVNFNLYIYNGNNPTDSVQFAKSDCLQVDADHYVARVDTQELGVGIYGARLVVSIPDTDYPNGTRIEIIPFDPQVCVIY